MKIAIVAAGFTPSEADRLRRAMATFRRVGTIQTFHEKMIEGMAAKGYDRDFAERCFRQIEGFGEYGFPESHAASFALLVYDSCWMKCRYPDVFAAAMLNAQPLGFYAPAQLVRDAREHGVDVREVDVNLSDWDCTLEALPPLPLTGEGRGEARQMRDRAASHPCATPRRTPSPANGRRVCISPPPRFHGRRHPHDPRRAPGPEADRRREGGGDAPARRAAGRRLRFPARPVAARRIAPRDPRKARRRRRLSLARPRPAAGFVGGAGARPCRRSGRSAAVRGEQARDARSSPTRGCRRCRSARMWSRITGACRSR